MGVFIEIGSVHKPFAQYALFKARLDQTIHNSSMLYSACLGSALLILIPCL